MQLRCAVAILRPQRPEPFLRLHMFPAEQAQVDWAHFGEVRVGRARRRLFCFVIARPAPICQCCVASFSFTHHMDKQVLPVRCLPQQNL